MQPPTSRFSFLIINRASLSRRSSHASRLGSKTRCNATNHDHADVAKLWEFDDADAELDLTIYVDSTSNRLSVFTKTGSYLGSIATRFSKQEGLRGIGFINHSRKHPCNRSWFQSGMASYHLERDKTILEPDHIEAPETLTGVSTDKKAIQVRDLDGKVDNILIERLSNFIQTRSTISQIEEQSKTKSLLQNSFTC